jgi:hypothetical protein
MFYDYLSSYFMVRKLRDYRPQPVTYTSLKNWIEQYGKDDRKHLRTLLKHVIYLNESETRKRLVNQNRVLLEKLEQSEVKSTNIIYIQIDEAGSSSPLMLNMLKEAAFLERRGCKFLDNKDVLGLNKLTNKLGQGAIVYIDDFVGTGNQFCGSRDFLIEHVVGTFSEFLITPCICEEAIYELGKRGVESLSEHVHLKGERPLHANCTRFNQSIKKRLIEIAMQIDPKGGLGYKNLASMVVLYRNAPNGVPLLLRGNLGQKPYKGILPRTQDFLPPQYLSKTNTVG